MPAAAFIRIARPPSGNFLCPKKMVWLTKQKYPFIGIATYFVNMWLQNG
ncbi:hypothetical protein AC73_3826 [Escherichia coli 2-427-07_S4_C1]|nr:hypothetical protein G2583_pO550117 [Escherichia coli O55:H7 str. CB9615]KDY40662.1 hypothetical protein AC73_3826 [Escherichia coli 2-427-07_S4_C1]